MRFSTLAFLLAAVLTVSALDRPSDPQCVYKGGTTGTAACAFTCSGGTFLSGLCPSFPSTAIKCCVQPTLGACIDKCKKTGASANPPKSCTGGIQRVLGKNTCVCTCSKSAPQMCGKIRSVNAPYNVVAKYICVWPSPGGVCHADGSCKTSISKTATTQSCGPCAGADL